MCELFVSDLHHDQKRAALARIDFGSRDGYSLGWTDEHGQRIGIETGVLWFLLTMNLVGEAKFDEISRVIQRRSRSAIGDDTIGVARALIRIARF